MAAAGDAVQRTSEPIAAVARQVLVEPLLSQVQLAASNYLDEDMTPPDDPTALCSTHWLPLAAASWPESPRAAHAPRHALEAAVVEVARAAASARLPSMRGAAVAGLEWWLQEQWPDDAPKEHHTDKVLGISSSGVAGEAGAPLHPLLSSVTYLSSTGGPTAVFAQRCPLVSDLPTRTRTRTLKPSPHPHSHPNPDPNPNPDPSPSPSPSPNPNPNPDLASDEPIEQAALGTDGVDEARVRALILDHLARAQLEDELRSRAVEMLLREEHVGRPWLGLGLGSDLVRVRVRVFKS